jgi:hypothetical protein
MPEGASKMVSDNTSDILEGYLDEAAYAKQRGVSVRTCQRDRQLRQSPPYVVIGNHIYYRIEAVRAWLRARERDPSPFVVRKRATAARRRS